MRLARRLTLSFSAVTLFTLAASFGAIYFIVVREETRELDAALRQETRAISMLVRQQSAALWNLNTENAAIPHPLKDVLNYKHLLNYAVAYDVENSPVVWSRDSMPSPIQFSSLDVHRPFRPEGTIFNHDYAGRPLRALVTPIEAGPIRCLLVGVSRADLDDDMTHLQELLAGLMVLAVLGAVGLASWLGHRVARDVKHIATIARRVAWGERDARVGGDRFGTTELRSLAVDLDHMIAQLSDLVTSQQTFVFHAAHELRTPLTGLRGELQLALRRQRSAEEYERVLALLAEDAEKLIILAEDLLTFARVEVPASPGEVSAVDMMVSEAVSLVHGLAQIREVEVIVTGLNGTLKVPGQRRDLGRALRNLLENAVVHSPSGQNVTLEIAATEHMVSIAVSDRGPGIPTDEKEQVFLPFYRGKRTQGSDYSGAGLGLAIARRIIEAQDGNLRLDSGYASGARFVVELPRVNAPV